MQTPHVYVLIRADPDCVLHTILSQPFCLVSHCLTVRALLNVSHTHFASITALCRSRMAPRSPWRQGPLGRRL